MNSREELVRIYLDKRPEAAAHLLESLSLEESVTLLSELPTRTSGPVLAAMHYYYSARCMTSLSVDYVVNVIQQLSSQRGATLLRALPAARQEAVLNKLAVHHAKTIRFLLSYSNNLVGAWMDPNAITVSMQSTVGEIRHRLQQIEVKDIHRLFLVDYEHHIQGSILISTLFQARDDVSLKNLAETKPKVLRARASLIVAEQHNDWRQYLEMPVIGRADEFIGIITYKNIARALQSLRHGQPDVGSNEDRKLHGLTDLYSLGLQGAWLTWMELLSIPTDDRGTNNEHKTGHHRGT